MKIAIIEDDKITRLELSKLLNSHGYETVLLTDFENLSEESKKYSFDLILLDINLPYENGYEICRKMKKLKNKKAAGLHMKPGSFFHISLYAKLSKLRFSDLY